MKRNFRDERGTVGRGQNGRGAFDGRAKESTALSAKTPCRAGTTRCRADDDASAVSAQRFARRANFIWVVGHFRRKRRLFTQLCLASGGVRKCGSYGSDGASPSRPKNGSRGGLSASAGFVFCGREAAPSGSV